MQGKLLGMKVEVFDPAGRNIEDTGIPGELVCTRAHPSLPLYFWNDKDGKKYESAYFSVYPGVWTQGDFMVVNPMTKGIRILGRRCVFCVPSVTYVSDTQKNEVTEC